MAQSHKTLQNYNFFLEQPNICLLFFDLLAFLSTINDFEGNK